MAKDLASQVRQIASEKEKKITPEELFHSHEFRAYAQNIVDSMTDRHHEDRVEVKVRDAGWSGFTAYTNGSQININVGNELVASYEELLPRFNATMGFVFHEEAHCLYLDFKAEELAMKYIDGGLFYGDEPKAETDEEHEQLNELKEVMQSRVYGKVFKKIYHELANIISDPHDEALLCRNFSKFVKYCIIAIQERLRASTSTLDDMIQSGVSPLSIMYNLTLQMARFGQVHVVDPNAPKCREYLDKLERYKTNLEIARTTDNPVEKFTQINQILLVLWPYIKAKLPDADDNSSSGSGDGGQGDGEPGENQGSGSGSGQSNSNESSDSSSDGSQSQNGQNSGSSANGSPSNKTQGTASNGGAGSSNPEDIERAIQDIMDALNKGSEGSGKTEDVKNRDASKTAQEQTMKGKINTNKKSRSSESPDKGSEEKNDDSNTGDDQTSQSHVSECGVGADVLRQIMRQIASNYAEAQLSEELNDAVMNDVKTADHNDTHKGVRMIAQRVRDVSQSDIALYNEKMSKLKSYSKRMQKDVMEILRELREGETLRHRLYGTSFVANDSYRPDNKCFSQVKLPQEWPSVAVSVLVDLSGSMEGERIERSKQAAMLLHDFCTGLGIPVQVSGHTTSSNSVRYIVYTDYKDTGNRDRYRLAQIHAYDGANRDGMAIETSLYMLSKRTEDIRMFFIISDGKPNHTLTNGRAYGGDGAVPDIQSIVRKYRRQGIETFACAIGHDRPTIKKIYGDGYLDIADLSTFPKKLVSAVKKRIT